jgi:hypothetical protein
VRYAENMTVVLRFLQPDGRIAAAQSARVIADDDRGLTLWLDIGAARMRRTTLDGTPTRHLPVRDELATATMPSPATWGPATALPAWWDMPGAEVAGMPSGSYRPDVEFGSPPTSGAAIH